MFHICKVIESVNENSSDFNFITWTSTINLIIYNKDFFLAWDSARRYCTWSFLNSHFLVVSVHCVNFISDERTIALAYNTLPKILLCFVDTIVENRSLYITASASEIDLLALGEYTSTLSYHTTNFDQSIQVNLP